MARADSHDTTTASRRRFLVTVAGASAVSAASLATAALPEPALYVTTTAPAHHCDPVFAAIDAHRKTHVVHLAALEVQSRLEDNEGRNHGEVSEQACCDENEAFEVLIAQPATTLSGLGAKLAYLEELAGNSETEWMVNELLESADLIRSFAASLRKIVVLS